MSGNLRNDDHTPTIAPTLARAIVAVVFCGFAGVALLWVVELGASVGEFVLAVVCLAGLLGLQYFYFGSPDTDLHSPRSFAVLVLQAGLVYLPLPLYGQAWVSQPPFLAASVLLVLRPRLAWPVFAAIVAGTGLAQAVVVAPVAMEVGYILVNSATAGLFVYGLTRLARQVTALHEARDELARTAVARERLRFAGQLHDLIGSCLSAIAPKGELALRLVRRDPERARQELSEMRGIARQAVADARELAHMYWGISPDDRPATPASMPSASDVDPRVRLDGGLDNATKLANWLGAVALTGLFVQAVIRMLWDTEVSWHIAVSAPCLLGALVLQLAFFSRPGARPRTPHGILLLGLLALLVFLPWLLFRDPWTGLAGFLGGSALLMLRPVLGWTVFVAVVAAVASAHIGYGEVRPRAAGLITINLGLIAYGLTWMARTVRQLRAARLDLAETALAETRLRLARDLHDLLGLSLSAIALKSDLAFRLIDRDPDRAHAELAAVLDIARHALADVRTVASGRHEMSLAQECATAQALLPTAGFEVRMDVPADDDLPPDAGAVLATVLREGVTNVLRHSDGERCEITVTRHADEVLLRIVNDGVSAAAVSDNGGSGIRNMSDRVAALGGEISAGTTADGTFSLSARVPLRGA